LEEEEERRTGGGGSIDTRSKTILLLFPLSEIF
jgi:hypothetical protein